MSRNILVDPVGPWL